MMGSLGVEGRQRKDILEAIGGSTKKIMETIQTQRTRKITAGKEANVDTDDDKDGE
jgi:predicted secreted protein